MALFCYAECCQKWVIVHPLGISKGQYHFKLQVEEYVTLFHSKEIQLPVKFRNNTNFDLLLPGNVSRGPY